MHTSHKQRKECSTSSLCRPTLRAWRGPGRDLHRHPSRYRHILPSTLCILARRSSHVSSVPIICQIPSCSSLSHCKKPLLAQLRHPKQRLATCVNLAVGDGSGDISEGPDLPQNAERLSSISHPTSLLLMNEQLPQTSRKATLLGSRNSAQNILFFGATSLTSQTSTPPSSSIFPGFIV